MSKTAESAQKAWSVLTKHIEQRATDGDLAPGLISYNTLGSRVGYKSPSGQPAGQMIKYLNSYCEMNDLPKLTANVVSVSNGLPRWEDMFDTIEQSEAEQLRVNNFSWCDVPVPSVADLDAARDEYESRHP